jgi:Tetratricopeptide repeat
MTPPKKRWSAPSVSTITGGTPLGCRTLTTKELGDDGALQTEVAVNLSNIAACRLACGDPTNAERLFRQALGIKQAILGPDHPEIARQLNNLAVAVAQQHRENEATELN